MPIDIDLDAVPTIDEIESDAKSGGLIPKGPRRMILASADEMEKKGKSYTKLVFEIATGPFADRKIFHDLYHSSDKGGEATEECKKAYIYWGSRLGLFAKNPQTGKPAYVAGKSTMYDCIGASVIGQIIEHEYDGKKSNKVTMYGVFMENEIEEKSKKTWGALADACDAASMAGATAAMTTKTGSKTTQPSNTPPTQANGQQPPNKPPTTAKPASDDFSDM